MEALRTGGEQPTVYYGLARLAALRADEAKALAYLDRVFSSDDPVLRQALRRDAVWSAPERSPSLRQAVEGYLAGVLPPSAEGSGS